jgi:hypothetical protein
MKSGNFDSNYLDSVLNQSNDYVYLLLDKVSFGYLPISAQKCADPNNSNIHKNINPSLHTPGAAGSGVMYTVHHLQHLEL